MNLQHNFFLSKSNQKKSIIFILLSIITFFGFLLRIQAITHTVVDVPVRADAAKYMSYAYNLKNFGIYSYNDSGIAGNPTQLKPDALATPGYPLFLVLFIDGNFTQQQYYTVLLVQAVLSGLTIVFGYLLFAGFNRAWALLIAFLIACSPHLVSMSTYLLSETLFCFFLMVFLWLASRFKAETPWVVFYFAGIFLGLATLTRPWTQMFIIILVIFLALSLPRRRLISSFLALLGFASIIAPWVIRNYLALGMPTDTTLSFTSIHHGMYPDMMYNFQPESLGFPYRFDPWVQNTTLSSQTVLAELYSRILENPWIYLKWYLWGKLTTVFSWNILGGMGDIFVYPVLKTPYIDLVHFKASYYFIKITHILCVILSLIGTVLAWMPFVKQRIPQGFVFTFRLLSLLILYFMLLHMIGAPFPRYSIPMRPVIYGMAVVILAWGSTYLFGRRESAVRTQS